jgi:hypothetical protein
MFRKNFLKNEKTFLRARGTLKLRDFKGFFQEILIKICVSTQIRVYS